MCPLCSPVSCHSIIITLRHYISDCLGLTAGWAARGQSWHECGVPVDLCAVPSLNALAAPHIDRPLTDSTVLERAAANQLAIRSGGRLALRRRRGIVACVGMCAAPSYTFYPSRNACSLSRCSYICRPPALDCGTSGPSDLKGRARRVAGLGCRLGPAC